MNLIRNSKVKKLWDINSKIIDVLFFAFINWSFISIFDEKVFLLSNL